ncbi:hypothetical protein D3C76_517850 [compost metagenome]
MFEHFITKRRAEPLRSLRCIVLAYHRAAKAKHRHQHHQTAHAVYISTVMISNPVIDDQRDNGRQNQLQNRFHQFKDWTDDSFFFVRF